MTTYFTCIDKAVELREVAGEMNSILSSGGVTVAGQKKITVGDSSFSFTTFRKTDSRTYVCATPDYMTSYYVTFPKDTDASVTNELDRVLTALVEGRNPNLEKIKAVGSAAVKSVADAGTSVGAAAYAAGSAAASAVTGAARSTAAAAGSAYQRATGPSAPAEPADAASQKDGPVNPAIQQAAGFMGAVWNAGTGMALKAGETAQKVGSEVMKKAQEDTKIVMDAIQGKHKTTTDGEAALAAEGHAQGPAASTENA